MHNDRGKNRGKKGMNLCLLRSFALKSPVWLFFGLPVKGLVNKESAYWPGLVQSMLLNGWNFDRCIVVVALLVLPSLL